MPATKSLTDAKVRRQKQILAVGSVILLALLGFELPKMLGGGGGSSETAPATSTAATLPGSPLAAAPGKLPDTDRVVVQPQSGQLISFGLFKSKDPFVPQLSTNPTALPSSPSPALPTATTPVVTTSAPHVPPRTTGTGLTPVTTRASTTPAASLPNPLTTPVTPTPVAPTPLTPTPVTPITPTPVTSGTTTPATTPTLPTAAPTSVAISTNGACETVALNGTFPGNEDIFRVVSIAKDGKSAKIGVVGGAYDSGQATATLKLGESLTLVNTADGTRYVIALKTKCDVQAQPVKPSTTTGATTTTTTTAAIPTTTATTPIVTDALDTTTPTG